MIIEFNDEDVFIPTAEQIAIYDRARLRRQRDRLVNLRAEPIPRHPMVAFYHTEWLAATQDHYYDLIDRATQSEIWRVLGHASLDEFLVAEGFTL